MPFVLIYQIGRFDLQQPQQFLPIQYDEIEQISINHNNIRLTPLRNQAGRPVRYTEKICQGFRPGSDDVAQLAPFVDRQRSGAEPCGSVNAVKQPGKTYIRRITPVAQQPICAAEMHIQTSITVRDTIGPQCIEQEFPAYLLGRPELHRSYNSVLNISVIRISGQLRVTPRATWGILPGKQIRRFGFG